MGDEKVKIPWYVLIGMGLLVVTVILRVLEIL